MTSDTSGHRAGRKPQGKPSTLEEAQKRIEELEAAYEKEAKEKEILYCRSEFLKLDLKWANIEAAEVRGEAVDESKGPLKKKHTKITKRGDGRAAQSSPAELCEAQQR